MSVVLPETIQTKGIIRTQPYAVLHHRFPAGGNLGIPPPFVLPYRSV